MILASIQMSLPRKSSGIMLKMSILHHQFNDLFLFRRRVMSWSGTAADEAWAQGQILCFPGLYSQLIIYHLPHPGVFHEYFRARLQALQCYQRRRDTSKSMTNRFIKDQRAAKVQVLFRDQLNLIAWILIVSTLM